MSKILVLAEKPSVGREIARVLGCKKSANGYIEGPLYVVTWALGHLVELADPEHYNKQYKTWSLESLPMLPERMDLKVIPKTAKQFGVVKTLLHKPDITSLIIATDAGREGELVARWIIAKAGFKKPIKRLWISSQTDKAIKAGFSTLRDGKEYFNLYQSAQGRAEADWLIGLNVTRALTCKYNAQLSAGRVQTPSLAMIVEREQEIKKFIPKEYFTVNVDLGNFFVTYKDSNNQTAIFEKEKANEIVQKIKGKSFRLTDLKKTDKRTPPPMLYDLTELQRDASNLYNYSPKQTLSIMQTLYERHKALTYPRTDSRYLTDDIVPTLTDRLKAVSIGTFLPIAREVIASRNSISKACINNAKVSDHHAIIPTEQRINLSNLSSEENKIYSLVVKRFLTCFYPPYEYRQMRAEFLCEGEQFYATGREIINKGWKKVYDRQDEDEQDEQVLPSLKHGDTFSCNNTQIKAGKTKPPARYTEATLLSAMENPSKFIKDTKMKEYIEGGLGTPATRADIIEKLFSSFYVEKQGKSIVPTSKGIQLVHLVPTDLKEPLLTAKWEKELDAIKSGKANKTVFVNQMKQYATNLVKTVIASDTKYIHDNLTKTVCPECGKHLLEVTGKKGKMLVCQDRDCGYRQAVSFLSNARCPNCRKKLEVFGDGEKRTYICRCGFREKVDYFHKDKGGSGANKGEVQQYLNTQEKQKDDGPSAFELALQKAMQKKK